MAAAQPESLTRRDETRTLHERIETLLGVYQARMRGLLESAPASVRDELADLVPSLGDPAMSESDIRNLQGQVGEALPPSLVTYLRAARVETYLEWNEIIIPGNTAQKK